MDELTEFWYSQLKEIPGKDFYNLSLKTKSLCIDSIASVIGVQLDTEQETTLNCLAFQVVQDELSPLLFDLRRASYPPKDMFDSEKLHDLKQMIKVAEYHEISFIETILKQALKLHTQLKD